MRCSSEAGAKSYLRWAAYPLISSFMFLCIFCWRCLHVLANPLSLCLDQIAHQFSLEKWHMWGLSLPFVCEPYLLFVLFLCFWSSYASNFGIVLQLYVKHMFFSRMRRRTAHQYIKKEKKGVKSPKTKRLQGWRVCNTPCIL